MKKVEIIKANYEDWKPIAQLHAQSWKENYRGIYSDDYLDNHVDRDRNELWQKRFDQPKPGQHVLIAKYNNEFCGFSCTFHDYDDRSRTYLDNLHVSSIYRSKGIGQLLLEKTIQDGFGTRPKVEFYLLVYTVNVRAIQFYKNNGAHLSQPYLMNNADGNQAEVVECIWNPS